MMKDEKILILGAGGFIGGRTYELFKQKGYNVTGTSKDGELLKLDVTKDDWKQLILDIRPTVIINAIAYGNSNNDEDKALIKEIILDFPKELIQFCHEKLFLNAFVQFGSSSEYGTNCTNASEYFELHPNSDYSINKGLLSDFCNYFTHYYNFPLIYFRLFSIYGPREHEGRLIPTLIKYAKEGGLPPLGDSEIARDFVHVDDVIRAIQKGIKKIDKAKGQIFNICSGKNTTLSDLVKITKKVFEIEASPKFGTRPNHKWDLEHWYGNPSKAKDVLDWKAKISLKDYLEEERNNRS